MDQSGNKSFESCTAESTEQKILQEQMEKAIKASMLPTSSICSDIENNVTAAIKIEMAIFDNNGKRGRFLQKAYEYLMSILATSVEAECAFSTAGCLCTKIRSSLSDNTLDALCFIRSYYLAKNK